MTAPREVAPGSLARDRKIAYLLGFAMIALIVAIGAAVVTMQQMLRESRLVEHTLQVEAAANRLGTLNERIESGRRGYIIDPSPPFRRVVETASSDFAGELENVARLSADNGIQRARVAEIRVLFGQRQALATQLFASLRVGHPSLHVGNFDAEPGVIMVRRMRAIIVQMVGTEARLLNQRSQAQLASLVQLYLIGGAALALLIGLLGTVIRSVVRYNRKLDAAGVLLQSANEGLEAAVAARTDELQRANEEIQRFAYIVSHDLRSPLVNVLGFTSELERAFKTMQGFLDETCERHPEMHDEAVWQAVEEDVPEALGFIRTSTEKMDRLINSILQLSRQGRRRLAPEHLDLTAVAQTVVATLHQRALDAGATVTVGDLPPIENDRIAVEQLLSNLIENAIKYLSPDRVGKIAVTGRAQGRFVEIEVSDNGRGIAPADHERIFELFRRSGAQDQPGEGIGLANVRALTYRLGGTITVESELDHGTRFRLSLPANFVARDFAHE